MRSERRGRVAVLGSLNVDTTLGVKTLPGPGETVSAEWSLDSFGGKGANQALAAARAGGSVVMLGRVGNDGKGSKYREFLKREGIDVSGISNSAEMVATGTAFIVVDDNGENTIVVDPGANGTVDETLVEEHAGLIEGADILLAQLECPLPAVKRAAEIARSSGGRIVINPSPWDDAFQGAGIPCDYLIVNANEAGRLLGGERFNQGKLNPDVLSKLGLEVIVVTRGSQPTICLSLESGIEMCAPPPVSPVDTVGAGDSFAGAFSVAIAEGRPVREAVDFGNVSGALATLKVGAQSAIPARAEIIEKLAEIREKGKDAG